MKVITLLFNMIDNIYVILFVIFYYERNHILPNEEGKNPNAPSLRIVR